MKYLGISILKGIPGGSVGKNPASEGDAGAVSG